MRHPVAIATVLVAVVATGACSSTPTRATSAIHDDAITVASFDFPESVILAELYAQALERAGFRVIRKLDLGPREFVEPALQRGLVELVPEYSGSLLEFLTQAPGVSADPETVRRELDGALERRGLAQLEAAPAQDQNAFAVTRTFAQEHTADSLSDLAGVRDLTLGGPAECADRPLCMPGLEQTYGLSFDDLVTLDLGGPITADALTRGVVDVALMLTTSAELSRGDLVLLADDRHLQPAEHVTPVVAATTLRRFGPSFADALDAVSAQLTTEDLRALNADVELEGRSPAAAARAWLDAHGFPAAEA